MSGQDQHNSRGCAAGAETRKANIFETEWSHPPSRPVAKPSCAAEGGRVQCVAAAVTPKAFNPKKKNVLKLLLTPRKSRR
jgi:hypothetical protein